MTESQFNEINSILNDNKNAIIFIKDYILRFRFADIACHSIGNQTQALGISYETTETINSKYNKSADKIIDEYHNKVKSICSKNNITTQCENDNLRGVKKDLDNAKYITYEKIIDLYNGIDKLPFTSGKRSDFMLSDLYLSYILDDDFVYDSDNPYVVELVYDIETFLNTRKRLESTSSNVASSIVKFNQMCNDNISQYWSANQKDYYSEMKERFQYDFYANNDTELIEAKINDDNRVTLYSKVLDYLKTLTKYTAPENTAEKYKNMTTDDMIKYQRVEDTPNEKSNAEKLKKLKKIAIQFTYLKKLESDVDPSYFSEFISENNLKDIFTLESILDSMNMTLDDYNKVCQINSSLRNYSKAMDSYIGALKSITEKESRILRELSDRAINWYLQNSKKIDDGTIFEQFMEVKWPTPTRIYKNGFPMDFYYIEEPQTLEEAQNNEKQETPFDGYKYTEDSVITEYGVDSYQYWLKYCTVATLVNCMLPMYWATGLIMLGTPILLPIIFIPITVISGRVTVVIGLGVCGICPLPMMYFVNMGDLPGYLIPSVNIAIDVLRKIPANLMETGNKSIKNLVKNLIEENDRKIDEKTDEIDQIDKQIVNLSAGIKEDKETLRNMKKRLKKDSTTNKSKNGA